MGFLIDLHVHTRRHSPCSTIDPARLIPKAVQAGLDGLVITEHQYQWRPEELSALLIEAGQPDFVLLAGFEYTSKQGDILVFGLSADQTECFPRGLTPGDAVARAHDLGAACIGAHPTRAGMGFGDHLVSLPLDALEVRSMNLKDHEQRSALQLARDTGLRPIAASDAHQIQNVGAYCTEFDGPIASITDLRDALRRGTFRILEKDEPRIGIP